LHLHAGIVTGSGGRGFRGSCAGGHRDRRTRAHDCRSNITNGGKSQNRTPKKMARAVS